MIKRTINLFTLLFIMCEAMITFMFLASAENGYIDQAKKGVAIIHNNETGGFGTCFAIGAMGEDVYYFITNNHCVVNNSDEVCDVGIIVSYEKNAYTASVEFRDAVLDYAILKTDRAVKDVIPLALSTNPIYETEQIFIVGFPGEGMDYYVDDEGYAHYYLDVAKNPPKITSGEITSCRQDFDDTKDLFTSSAHVNGGNSGGPVIDADNGLVVGVAEGKDTYLDRVTFGVKISNIIEQLDLQKIKYETENYISIEANNDDDAPEVTKDITWNLEATPVATSEKETASDILNTWITIAIVCILSIFLVLMAFILIRKEPQNLGEKPPEYNDDDPPKTKIVHMYKLDHYSSTGEISRLSECKELTEKYISPGAWTFGSNTHFGKGFDELDKNHFSISVSANNISVINKNGSKTTVFINDDICYVLTGKDDAVTIPSKYREFYIFCGDQTENYFHFYE